MDDREGAIEFFARAHDVAFAPDVDESLIEPRYYIASFHTKANYGFAQNVVTGVWSGVYLQEMDYSTATASDFAGPNFGGIPNVGPFRAGYSLVKVPVDGDLPYLFVSHKDWLTRLADDVDRLDHLHHDRLELTTADREFDKVFEVRGWNQAFAEALFTPRLTQTMLKVARDFAMEIAGKAFLLYRTLMPVEELPSLLDAAALVAEHIQTPAVAHYSALNGATRG